MSSENPRYAQIKALLATAGARFVSVHFIKKDGSERVMSYNPKAAARRVVGDAASASAKQAVETRASNHPEFINVWDSKSQGFRSVNMNTIFKIVVDGQTYLLPAPIGSATKKSATNLADGGIHRIL